MPTEAIHRWLAPIQEVANATWIATWIAIVAPLAIDKNVHSYDHSRQECLGLECNVAKLKARSTSEEPTRVPLKADEKS